MDFGCPKFSPDAKKIACFGYSRSTSEVGIFLYDLELKNGFQFLSPTGYLSEYLDWSPDGEWIAYSSVVFDYKSYECDIYKIRPDGTDNQLLWDGAKFSEEFTIQGLNWSDDGKYIAIGTEEYVPGAVTCNRCILLINSDGSGKHKILVPPEKSGAYPEFDSTGENVLFVRYGGPWQRFGIEQVDFTGGNEEMIVEGMYPTTYPGSPYIYFEKEYEIWRYRMY